ERLNAPVLKTGDGRPSVGSNPTSSAIYTEPMQPCCVGFLFACNLPLLIDLNTLVFFNSFFDLLTCGLNSCHKITYQHLTSAFLDWPLEDPDTSPLLT
ncbi:hypothetical protein NUK45_20620, partial [Aeromonas veronii]|uniref:hypothetical protein n=1 Tax=Aeromonas veronii TaxID=654 RepID=UPI00214D2087